MPYIDGLPAATSVSASDIIVVDQGGTAGIPGTATTRRATIAQIQSNLTITPTGGTVARSLALISADAGLPAASLATLALDGVTDDSAALNAALSAAAAAGISRVYLPPGKTAYCASGITIPAGVILEGAGLIPSGGQAVGTTLLFALNVATCVTLNGSLGGIAAGLRGMIVERAAGTIPAGSIGVYISNGFNTPLIDVLAMNHAIGFSFFAGVGGGISCSPERIFTTNISDTHILISSWPELRISQSRFGSNGSYDQNCNSFIRITGSGGWPNTLQITNSQFNQGEATNPVATFMDYVSLSAGEGGIVSELSVADSHIEGAQLVIRTDSTTTNLSRITFSNVQFQSNPGNTYNFWSLNAATAVNYFKMSCCDIMQIFNYTPSLQTNWMNVTDCTIQGMTTVHGVTGSTVAFSGCAFMGGLTVTGNFGSAVFNGVIGSGLSPSNTATGYVELDLGAKGWTAAAAPVITFGGTATATYSTVNAQWKLQGGQVTYQFAIILTAVGAATGVAKISGLPFATGSAVGSAGNATLGYATGMASLSGPVMLSPDIGLTTVSMYVYTSTGVQQITNANFTATTAISGEIIYNI